MFFNQNNINVAKIAAKDTARPEIASVFITPDKTVATDSFKLIEMSTPKTTPEALADYPAKSMRGFKPFMVDAKTLSGVKIKTNKELPMLNNFTVKHVDNDKVELNIPTNSDGAAELTEGKVLRRVDGQYPDYQQIFPKEKPVLEIKLNGNYLAELCKLLVKSNEGTNQKVVLKVWGTLQPVQLENTNMEQPARALLMPIQS